MVMTRGSQRRDMANADRLDNPLRLASADFGGKTLALALKLLDSAEKYKQLNIIYGHKIVGTDTVPASGGAAPGDTLTWNRSDYLAFADSLADRITAGTIQNVTYSDLLDKFKGLIPSCTKIMPTYTSVCAKCGKVYEFKATVAERINNRPECCGKRLKALFTQFLERWISQQRSNRLAGS